MIKAVLQCCRLFALWQIDWICHPPHYCILLKRAAAAKKREGGLLDYDAPSVPPSMEISTSVKATERGERQEAQPLFLVGGVGQAKDGGGGGGEDA